LGADRLFLSRLFERGRFNFVAVEVQRSIRCPNQKHRQDESGITNPIHQERLLSGRRRLGLLIPKSNQQIAAKTDRLPKHEQQQQVAGRNQHRHGKDEQRKI